jgi:polyisoprenyl-phosphate glycosyltransferase
MIAEQHVAALIPAHNECGRVGKVLTILKAVKELDEIIVVDDGSSDATYTELQEFAIHEPRLRPLRLPTNRGKGGAIFAGAQATQAECLLFLDADLLGLQPEHIQSLIEPVCAGQLDMAIGVFYGGRLLTDLSHWATPFMSGQRCLRASLFAQVRQDAAVGYGIETAITLTARKEMWRYRYIPWRGVWHPSSETRRGVLGGGFVRLKMYFEVLRAIYRHCDSATG